MQNLVEVVAVLLWIGSHTTEQIVHFVLITPLKPGVAPSVPSPILH